MMDDLISRRDAINAVSEITTTMSVCTNKDECYGMKRMQKQALTELENLPSAEPNTTTHDSIPVETGKKDDYGTSGDCISRQAAIEPEAISEWKKEFREYVDSLDIKRDDWKGIIEYIDELPSAQPDIIQCKDCKWYGRADKRRFYRGMDCLQKRIDTIVPDRDFCSRAERKENGH